MAVRTWAGVALTTALLCSGCTGNDGTAAQGTPSRTAAAVFTTAPPPTLDPAAALSQPVTTTVFKPGFSLRVPAGWIPAERDVSGFQTYLGAEDFEITLDHTYQRRESIDQGVARLSATPGVMAGPISNVVVGGRGAKAFVLQTASGVQFPDSGFHTPDAGPIGLAVLGVPDGTTVTVFLTTRTDRAASLAALRALTNRVFATLRWK